MSDKPVDESVRDWYYANDIIGKALREWFPTISEEQAEAYAVAIQARLAQEHLQVVNSDRINY
jgi:hypothetical protein